MPALAPQHCAFTERLGNQLPFIFINYIAWLVCPNLLYENAVTFKNADHLPNTGYVLGGIRLEPTYSEAKPVSSKGSGLLKIVVEPLSQMVQLIRVRTRDHLPFQCLRCGVKDSSLDMAILISATCHKPDVFSFFQVVMSLEDEALIFRFHKNQSSRDARKNGAHAASDHLLEGFQKRKFLLVEPAIL